MTLGLFLYPILLKKIWWAVKFRSISGYVFSCCIKGFIWNALRPPVDAKQLDHSACSHRPGREAHMLVIIIPLCAFA